MRATASAICKNRIVSCIHWSSSYDIIFGLRGGDTLVMGLQEETLSEYLLRDAAFLQVLWNGIMQTESPNKATLAVHSVETNTEDIIVVSASNEGILRIWNSVSRKCVIQVSLCQVLKGLILFQNIEGIP